ncbi:MAG: hypothetical protein FJZ92_06420 [Chloroflexi bacterium]|nr:hypothetical protein [Chloroflexota bacterium]
MTRSTGCTTTPTARVARMVRDRASVEACTRLLWVAHNLERIADRATNIAERVVFLVSGELPQMNASSD